MRQAERVLKGDALLRPGPRLGLQERAHSADVDARLVGETLGRPPPTGHRFAHQCRGTVLAFLIHALSVAETSRNIIPRFGELLPRNSGKHAGSYTGVRRSDLRFLVSSAL